MNDLLKSCPFCGGKATIVCCDDEGNIHDDDYENDPWSGLGYQIRHSHEENKDCPIATYAAEGAIVGDVYIYDTREEAIEAWNRRANDDNPHCADVEEVRHAKWVHYGENIQCSNCEHVTDEICYEGDMDSGYYTVLPHYCSNCGAKMDLEDE